MFHPRFNAKVTYQFHSVLLVVTKLLEYCFADEKMSSQLIAVNSTFSIELRDLKNCFDVIVKIILFVNRNFEFCLEFSSLRRGSNLPLGGQIISENGRFTFILKRDGNMVIYDSDDVIYWSSETNGMSPSEDGKGVCRFSELIYRVKFFFSSWIPVSIYHQVLLGVLHILALINSNRITRKH